MVYCWLEKQNFGNTLIALFLLFGLMRCAPLQVPASHNIPMLSGKGEFQASAGAGMGFNFQTAYAITDHVGVAANYLFAKRGEQYRGRKHQGGELALGYYTNFNESWCFEVFSGAGISKGSAYDSSYYSGFVILGDYTRYEATGSFSKFYIQPSVGFRKNDFVWSFSTKLSYVTSDDIDIVLDDKLSLGGKSSQMFLSWVCDGQVPIGKKKKTFMHYQLGLNFPTDDPVYDYEYLMASVGLLVKLKPTK